MKIETKKKEVNVYTFELTYDEVKVLRRTLDEIEGSECFYLYYNNPFLSELLEELRIITADETL